MADPGLGAQEPRPGPAGDHPHGVDTHSRRPDVALLAVAELAVVTALATLAVNAAYNQGRVVPPLDDVYIHLQYDHQIGLGEFLRYQPGAPPTTGAGSLLYVVLLGAAAVAVPSGPRGGDAADRAVAGRPLPAAGSCRSWSCSPSWAPERSGRPRASPAGVAVLTPLRCTSCP